MAYATAATPEVEVRSLVAFLLLVFCAATGSGDGSRPPAVFPLIYSGQVLLADASKLELRFVGTLTRVALAVTADPEGRIWGRLEPRHFAALDPASGQMVARVALPRAAQYALITPAGKAYVTHPSGTKEGYTLSVVDTRRKALLREITGIAGLYTDLARTSGFVYLAAEGARKEDRQNSYLYQIDEATDRIREALRMTDAGYFWKLAAGGDFLYLGYLPVRDNPGFGRVEVRDARSLNLIRSWEQAPGPLRALYATAEKVLLFSEREGGGTELLVLDPLLRAGPQVRLLAGPVAHVLGIHGATLVYLDYPFEAGYQNVSVCFYELEAGRELKRINIREHLFAGVETWRGR